jgi:hypothetical protein
VSRHAIQGPGRLVHVVASGDDFDRHAAHLDVETRVYSLWRGSHWTSAPADDSSYGLACGAWTPDLKWTRRMVQNVEAGAVWVNACRRIHWTVPFGGVKDSDHG